MCTIHSLNGWARLRIVFFVVAWLAAHAYFAALQPSDDFTPLARALMGVAAGIFHLGILAAIGAGIYAVYRWVRRGFEENK